MEEKVKKRMESCRRRLKQMDQDESDEEYVESLRHQLEIWERKQEFINSVVGLGFLPCDVPGDGNCALWTLSALQAGCFIRTATSTLEKTMQLRQDIGQNGRKILSWVLVWLEAKKLTNQQLYVESLYGKKNSPKMWF